MKEKEIDRYPRAAYQRSRRNLGWSSSIQAALALVPAGESTLGCARRGAHGLRVDLRRGWTPPYDDSS